MLTRDKNLEHYMGRCDSDQKSLSVKGVGCMKAVEFPDKVLKFESIDSLLNRICKTSTIAREPGSGRPFAHSDKDIEQVEELAQSGGQTKNAQIKSSDFA